MEEKERFMNTIEDVNNDDVILQEWIAEENERLKNEGQLSYAREEGIELGREEGIELGREEGIELGKEQGIEIGKEESIIELIKNMLVKGTDYEYISEITGKTIDEIIEIASAIEE